MQEDQYNELIAKYLSGNMNTEESARLMAWKEEHVTNQAIFDEIQDIWEATADLEVDLSFKAPNWSDFEQKLSIEASVDEMPTVKPARFRKIFFRIAATLLFLVTAGIAWQFFSKRAPNSNPIAIITPLGERQEITLPDGSQIWVNQNSRVVYDSFFEQRLVHLEGEAFFEVTPDKERPFVIRSGETSTTVVGTSFNVRAYPDEPQIEVTVETGEVFVQKTANQEQKITLQANQSGIYYKQTDSLQTTPQKISNAQAWKKQRLVYENSPLSNVKTDLERYFNITIIVNNPALLKCTWKFNQMTDRPDLETIFNMLSYNLELQVSKNKDTYIWDGPGCQ